MNADEAVVVRFNEAINARALDDLAALMTDDHRFVDATGAAVEGREACVEAWRGFFGAFPSYRNEFEAVAGVHHVAVRGRSVAPVPELDGPALWSARVEHGRVAEWRVLDDTPDNRERLGLA